MASCNHISGIAQGRLNRFNRAVGSRLTCDIPTLVAVFEMCSDTPIKNAIARGDFTAVKPFGKWEVDCDSIREFIIKSY